ncbi:flagellar hook-length control protein FliK [Burkholderia sp. Z1]|uniref:flagellar hook-length control protein FliK n=1 Tax=Burkholderia sp. Z1 TaxID=2759039 RepID=UPI0018677F2E|nr:flagellar hook-length control protein FliK [Burkholderia sp. Z1]
MTEFVSTPRSPSRSNRSSTRARQRSAAAAGSTSARATARSGSAPAGDASRDERTFDLFGDPVLEPGERMPAAARDEAVAEAETAAGVADDVAAGRQAALDGFSAPEAASAVGQAEAESAVKPDVAVAADGVSVPEGGDASDAGDVPAADGAAIKLADVPAVDGATVSATERQAADAASAKTSEPQAVDGEVAKPVVEAAAVKSREGRSSGDAVKERRSSSGGKRRAAVSASEATAVRSVSVAASVDTPLEAAGSNPTPDAVSTVEPQTPVQPVEAANPANTANTAPPRDAAPADASLSAVAQPVASAASFVTKPSAERAQPAVPAFDPDTHLRPLTDRLAVLQSDVDGLTRAADREMRRVNRLLLALAVVVLAGLVALMLQTRQIAHLKQDAAAKQQRIDRLAADLSTQQATLMTLEEHHEALLSQVDRLQRSANREAAVAKRARRTR